MAPSLLNAVLGRAINIIRGAFDYISDLCGLIVSGQSDEALGLAL